MMAKAQNRKRKRRTNHITPVKKNYYIFCEGEKTEPNYFEGMKRQIISNPIYKNMIHICVEGTARNTLGVLSYAQTYISKNKVSCADVWCVYDKDDFPDYNFDLTSDKIQELNEADCKITYHAAWSNQCIEYWFILHFALYDSNNDRECYISFLQKKFKQKGLNVYKKNEKDIFAIMSDKGNPKLAIRWAKERMSNWGNIEPS